MEYNMTRTEKNKMKEDVVSSLKGYLYETYKEIERNKDIYLNLEKFLEEVKRAIREKFRVIVLELLDITTMDITKYIDGIESDLVKLNSFKIAKYKTYNDYPYFKLMLDDTKQIYRKYCKYLEYGMFTDCFFRLTSICYRYKLDVDIRKFYKYQIPSLDDILYKDEEGNLWRGATIGGFKGEVSVCRKGEVKTFKLTEYKNVDFTDFLVDIYGEQILKK